MGIPASSFRHRCSIQRRQASSDILRPRGDFALVPELTRIAAGYRTNNLMREQQGNMPVAAYEGEIMLRLSRAVETITVEDVALLDGERMEIVSIDLPDRLNGVLRLKVKRKPGVG